MLMEMVQHSTLAAAPRNQEEKTSATAYTRAAPQPLGMGSTLVQDLNLIVREEE
jgi:hypothetical protein